MPRDRGNRSLVSKYAVPDDPCDPRVKIVGDLKGKVVLHIQITQLDKCRTYLSLVASVVTPVQLVTNVASWS
jgi:hypothetical protein